MFVLTVCCEAPKYIEKILSIVIDNQNLFFKLYKKLVYLPISIIHKACLGNQMINLWLEIILL